MRKKVKVLPLLGCMLTVILATGCGDACLDLAGRICNCLPDDGTRAECNRRAKDSESTFPVTAQDRAYCQHQLDTNACDCTQLATPEGKARKFVHHGSYDQLENTYDAITHFLDDNKLEARELYIEQYVTDPRTTAEDALVIEVLVPIK